MAEKVLFLVVIGVDSVIVCDYTFFIQSPVTGLHDSLGQGRGVCASLREKREALVVHADVGGTSGAMWQQAP